MLREEGWMFWEHGWDGEFEHLLGACKGAKDVYTGPIEAGRDHTQKDCLVCWEFRVPSLSESGPFWWTCLQG